MDTKKGLFWLLLFSIIFLLSQDYIFAEWEGKPAVFGFPLWVIWFVIIQVIYILIFYWFSKKYWKE